MVDRRRELAGADRVAVRGERARGMAGACQSTSVARASSTRFASTRSRASPCIAVGVASDDRRARATAPGRRSTSNPHRTRRAVAHACRKRRRACGGRGDRLHDGDDSGRPKGVMLTHAQPAVRRGPLGPAARARPGRPHLRRAADLPRVRLGLDAARHAVSPAPACSSCRASTRGARSTRIANDG